MKNVLNDIETFSDFSGLRLNLDKCEIVGIGVLKNVNVIHVFFYKKTNFLPEPQFY